MVPTFSGTRFWQSYLEKMPTCSGTRLWKDYKEVIPTSQDQILKRVHTVSRRPPVLDCLTINWKRCPPVRETEFEKIIYKWPLPPRTRIWKEHLDATCPGLFNYSMWNWYPPVLDCLTGIWKCLTGIWKWCPPVLDWNIVSVSGNDSHLFWIVLLVSGNGAHLFWIV